MQKGLNIHNHIITLNSFILNIEKLAGSLSDIVVVDLNYTSTSKISKTKKT